MIDPTMIRLNIVDLEVLEAILKDIEAYYRSEPYQKYYTSAQIGGKMMGVHRIRRVLGLEVEIAAHKDATILPDAKDRDRVEVYKKSMSQKGYR